jgi:Subtilase family
LITKRDKNGILLWEKTFSIAPVSQNYGVAVCTDLNDNVFVAGVCQNGAINKDILVLKYNPGGVLLWSQTYDSPNNQDEGAVAITCDPAGGQVFVTGPAMGTVTFSDYLTLAFDGGSGSLLWQQKYNGPANLPDVPIGITFNNGDVNVIGASGSATYKYDVTTLRYDNTGSLIDSMRYSEPGMKLDQPTALAKDLAGNLYITGSSSTNGVDFDIQTMKLNAADLSLAWVETYDLNGLEDKATSIAISNQGDVFITGYATVQPGKTELIAIKYDVNGNQQWTNRLGRDQTTARGQRCVLDPIGNLSITGVALNNNISSWVTYQFEPSSGTLLYERKLESGNNMDFQPTDIRWVNEDGFIVSGRDGNGYRSVFYQRYVVEYETVEDSLGTPSHAANQLVVNFTPSLLNMVFINDKQRFFANMDEVFPPSFLQDPRITFDIDRVKVVKIFEWMASTDSLSVTRLGDTITIPKFWSNLLFILPSEYDILSVGADLAAMTEYVGFTELNYTVLPDNIPNDPLFTGQGGLLNNTGSNGGINVDQAWDLETGEPHVRVAVTGMRTFFPHDDFVNAFGAGTNRIVDGLDMTTNGSIFDASNTNTIITDHETACSGIIAANRDNAVGVAGIAGGGLNGEGYTSQGVSLISLQFLVSSFPTSTFTADLADAFVLASNGPLDPVTAGFSADIISNSTSSSALSALLERSVNSAYRNGTLLVSSKGNDNNNLLRYPSSYDDEWIMGISASGVNNLRASAPDNDNLGPGYTTTTAGASFGCPLDVIAPGVISLVTAPTRDGTNNGPTVGSGLTGMYEGFDGTSAAVPHVAGVAALLHSMHVADEGYPNNLAPDDIEHLIENYATDITSDGTTLLTTGVGPDCVTGHGLVNAGLTLSMADFPFFYVLHSENASFVTLDDVETEELESETLLGRTFTKFRFSYYYSGTLPQGLELINVWGRNSSSKGIADMDFIPVEWYSATWPWVFPFDKVSYNVTSISDTEFSLKCETFGYKVTGLSVDPDEIYYIPTDFVNLATPFSLHIHDTNATESYDQLLAKNFSINPNPSSGDFTLKLNIALSETAVLNVSNITGNLIAQIKLEPGFDFITFNLSDFPAGVYLCTLLGSGVHESSQIVKL